MKDEVDAFWCFAGLMEELEVNFQKNSEGMENQLVQLCNLIKVMDYQFYSYLEDIEATNMYYCFRWILVRFKREFSLEDIKRLWEALFTEYMGSK